MPIVRPRPTRVRLLGRRKRRRTTRSWLQIDRPNRRSRSVGRLTDVPAYPHFDVCVVGSANLDLVARAPRHPKPGETLLGTQYAEHAGGKGVNQAIAASRSGSQVAFVGAVGDDGAGSYLRQTLAADQVDVSHLATISEPTGRALIVVDDSGENSIVVVPGANAFSTDNEIFPSAAVIQAQLEVPIDLVRRAFESADGATTILNPAPAAELPPELISVTNIVVPNEHELEIIGGAEPLLAAGCDAVVVTLGGAGVDIVTRDGTEHIDAFTVDVIDTTGAGDAFCGALASQLAAGADLVSAARWAAAAGALATTIAGAVPAQPRASSIRALLGR